MQLMIHEILEQVTTTKDRGQKIRILRSNVTPALKYILKYALDPRIKFYTDSPPVHKKDVGSPEGLSYSTLFNEHRRLYVFLEQEQERRLTGGKQTSIPRKNQLLIEMLETIHPGEAELLCSMIDGTFAKKTGITKKLIEEALPGLL